MNSNQVHKNLRWNSDDTLSSTTYWWRRYLQNKKIIKNLRNQNRVLWTFLKEELE